MRSKRELIPICLFLLGSALPAQREVQWVVPSRAVLAPMGATPVQIAEARAEVRIQDRTASTTLQFELHNPAAVAQEAVVLLPVPEGAAVSAFAFEGAAGEPTATIMGRDEARRLYDQITSKLRDPALLEFVDWRCLRSSVFPVPAHGRQRIRIGYDHVLTGDGARVDYVLPRSEMLTHDVPWTIRVELRCSAPIGLFYSPSHELLASRKGPGEFLLQVAEGSRREPGSFRLSFATTDDAAKPVASLYAYPDPKIGGGYFLLLVGAPAKNQQAGLRRELTLVLDRSGSMAGRKFEQAKAAALQVLEGLDDGEGIQLIEFGNTVGSAFGQPVVKSAETVAVARQWLERIGAHGGTNIHDALLEALRPAPLKDTLPLVLFLTDGLPTVGPTREVDLRRLVETGNAGHRRLFSFGVGNDVNAPLLDRIAAVTRGTTTYVQPDEDVELAVARAFARLAHPVLAEPVLHGVGNGGAVRVSDMLPARLPDLYAGDQLVVLGQYHGDDDLHFELEGTGPSGTSRYAFTLPVRTASTRHAFVPRLWASRQIALLVDELRQQGAEPGMTGTAAFAEPRQRELRDEILRLSTQFGVLGEYTAFLATEGSDLGNWQALTMACQDQLAGRAVAVRSGAGAVNQGCNLWAQKGQTTGNARNSYLDEHLQKVEIAAVQQICDRAFFHRGERWIDGNSVLNQRLQPDEQVDFGSQRYFDLLHRLQRDGRAGVLSLRGEVLIEVDGKNVLVMPAAAIPITKTSEEDHR